MLPLVLLARLLPPTKSCLLPAAGHVRQFTTRVTHVLPVSDDGGSTAEIVRVLGGPAVGDIRSRCLRLADDSDEEVRGSIQLGEDEKHSVLFGKNESIRRKD
jgi:hypothetical protein